MSLKELVIQSKDAESSGGTEISAESSSSHNSHGTKIDSNKSLKLLISRHNAEGAVCGNSKHNQQNTLPTGETTCKAQKEREDRNGSNTIVN